MEMDFDLEALNGLIAQAAADNKGPERGDYSGPKVTFLPAGKHKVRPFLDPERKMNRRINHHQFFGKKCLCPDLVNKENKQNPDFAKFVQELDPHFKSQEMTELPSCKICEYQDELKEALGGIAWKTKLGIKWNNLFYLALYESDSTDEYWQPDPQNGTPYAVVAKAKARVAIEDMMSSLAADSSAFLLGMLNPTKEGGIVSMTVTRGTQGGVAINVLPGSSKPAVVKEDSEWYKPLNDTWIRPTFNLEYYNEAVDKAKEVYEEWKGKLDSGEVVKVEEEGDEAAPADTTTPTAEVTTPAVGTEQTAEPAKPVESQVVEPAMTQGEPGAVTTVADTALTVETKSTEPGENQIKDRQNGQIIDLPAHVIANKCFSKFDVNAPDGICLNCPISMQCLYEQSVMSKAA